MAVNLSTLTFCKKSVKPVTKRGEVEAEGSAPSTKGLAWWKFSVLLLALTLPGLGPNWAHLVFLRISVSFSGYFQSSEENNLFAEI